MPGTSSIDGLVSGLNTTQIIDSLMKLAQKPVDQLTQEQTDKTNIVSAFQAVQAKMLSLTTQAGKLAQKANWNKYGVEVSDDNYLTATAGSNMGAGSYSVQVLSIAHNHTLASQGVSDQSQAMFGSGTITLSVGTGSAKTITVDGSNNSLTGIAAAINAASTGVTASIINDGSKSSPYRLVLTSAKTGQANKISVSSTLSGSQQLNFSTPTFDAPELLSTGTNTTSTISLGPTAAYSGTSNKTYTFTVAGTGTQTLGSDNITLNWTDGTNTGSIVVTQADTEVALVGAGSDGLKLNFSSGVMTGGDKFQIQSFAPVLQEASDATIAVGSDGGSGSPISITSSTNSFTSVIGGLNINVKKVTEPGSAITVQSSVDTEAARTLVNDFISAYNDVNTYINTQNKYNTDTKESGVLFGDLSLQTMQSSMRNVIANRLAGITSKFNQLYTVGIRSDADGNLSIKNSAALDEALQNNLEDVIKLFTASASTSSGLQFVASGTKTKVGQQFVVAITQAATQGKYTGSTLADPAATPLTLTSANNRLKLNVDGLNSDDIVLTEKTYSSAADLVTEIQNKIDADTRIGTRGLKVSWESFSDTTGRIVFQSPSYGSQSKVTMVTSVANSSLTTLGLAEGASIEGVDVAGTINGELADGAGQTLTAKDTNANTAGLKIRVTLDQSQVGNGTKGTITLAKGVGAKLNDLLDSFTASGNGMIDRQIKSYQNQVDSIKARIEEMNARLATKREDLFTKFNAMETALQQLSSQQQWLTGQLSSINANWGWNGSSSNNG
jgi:flagellar capping protein FliD